MFSFVISLNIVLATKRLLKCYNYQLSEPVDERILVVGTEESFLLKPTVKKQYKHQCGSEQQGNFYIFDNILWSTNSTSIHYLV